MLGYALKWPDLTFQNLLELNMNKETNTIKLDIPGVSKEDILLKVEGNKLILRTKEEAPRKYFYTEYLSRAIDPSSVKASLKDGVLEIALLRTPLNSQEIQID